jgi:hypothetical protein
MPWDMDHPSVEPVLGEVLSILKNYVRLKLSYLLNPINGSSNLRIATVRLFMPLNISPLSAIARAPCFLLRIVWVYKEKVYERRDLGERLDG